MIREGLTGVFVSVREWIRRFAKLIKCKKKIDKNARGGKLKEQRTQDRLARYNLSLGHAPHE